MKSRWLVVTCLVLGGLLMLTPVAEAKNKAKKKKGIPAAILEKYDLNKDGKLSKKERAAMTPEDAAQVPEKKKKNA